MKVADTIKSGDGTEYLIVRAWDWPKWVDFDLINKKTGEYGYLREEKGRKNGHNNSF